MRSNTFKSACEKRRMVARPDTKARQLKKEEWRLRIPSCANRSQGTASNRFKTTLFHPNPARFSYKLTDNHVQYVTKSLRGRCNTPTRHRFFPEEGENRLPAMRSRGGAPLAGPVPSYRETETGTPSPFLLRFSSTRWKTTAQAAARFPSWPCSGSWCRNASPARLRCATGRTGR